VITAVAAEKETKGVVLINFISCGGQTFDNFTSQLFPQQTLTFCLGAKANAPAAFLRFVPQSGF
jgi:hypothetical protein